MSNIYLKDTIEKKSTNANFKIWWYLHLYKKITRRRFLILKLFTFWDVHTWNMWNACIQTFRNKIICQKLAYFLRNLLTLDVNASIIIRLKIAKFLGHCFHTNINHGTIIRTGITCKEISLQKSTEIGMALK